MTDASKPAQAAADAAERMAAMGRIAEKSRRVAELWLSEGAAKGGGLPVGPGLANDFMALLQQLLANPMALAETQAEFWQDYFSREAARAANDAIPLLQLAELVLVVDARGASDHPGAELVVHLVRHEVRAELRQVASSGGIAETLLAQARAEAADLLVMGGYGHSRPREMILGGTTRQILDQNTTPVLIAH